MFTTPVGARSQRRSESIWPLMSLRVTPQGHKRYHKSTKMPCGLMKQIYGIDMEQTQHSKFLNELPPVDIVVTMGCNVTCPYLPCKHREDWGLEDPTGQSDDRYLQIMRQIEQKILELKAKL